MSIPKLHLKYAYPLDRDRRQLFADKNFGFYPSAEEVKKKLGDWKEIWENLNKEDKIFKLLIKFTGVTLPRDLEMYVYGGGLGAMSSPLIIPIMDKGGNILSNDQFIETAIHEITHRFVSDSENNPGIENYWEAIRKEYANESILTQNHIIIYALLEITLLALFGKERLKDFMHPKHLDYERAVFITSQKGSRKLIGQFQKYLQ